MIRTTAARRALLSPAIAGAQAAPSLVLECLDQA
jgi:hypothetical protein